MEKGTWLMITKSILKKIRRFFRDIFKESKQAPLQIEEKSNRDFKEYVKIEKDKEQEELLKFQEEFVRGNIREEDMEEEYEKLSTLYDEQILELEKQIKEEEDEIEADKQEIIQMMQELKNR